MKSGIFQGYIPDLSLFVAIPNEIKLILNLEACINLEIGDISRIFPRFLFVAIPKELKFGYRGYFVEIYTSNKIKESHNYIFIIVCIFFDRVKLVHFFVAPPTNLKWYLHQIGDISRIFPRFQSIRSHCKGTQIDFELGSIYKPWNRGYFKDISPILAYSYPTWKHV